MKCTPLAGYCAWGKKLYEVVHPFVQFRVTIGERNARSAGMILGREVNDYCWIHGYSHQRVIDSIRVLVHDDPEVGGAGPEDLRHSTVGAVSGIRISVET